MKKRLYLALFAALALCMISCEDWLDVKPTVQIEADKLYERESGFKDVLTGAYINMCSTPMYGREMMFGTVDVLGGVYTTTGSSDRYSKARVYDYENATVVGTFDGIWQNCYNTLSNLNHMIEHIKKANRSMFAPDNYNVILGEALGLRAYIHFDLLRLFGPSYKANKDAKAIPYVTGYKFTTTDLSTVSEVIEYIISDMKDASTLLKESDPIYTGREITSTDDEGYLMKREFRLNYYAVQAALARIYMWKGETGNAAACAREVIESNRFRWITFDEIATPTATERDRTLSPEQVFVLDCQRLEDNIATVLKRPGINLASSVSLLFTQTYLNSLYTLNDDWRKLYLWAIEGAANIEQSCTKFWQIEGMPVAYKYRLPLIRLPELYLILAESMIDTDPDSAGELISTLMLNRGIIGGVPAGTPPHEVRNVLELEYRREFPCEGVMFFYFKRIDAENITGAPNGVFDKSKYVLPIPEEEIEFGQRF